MHSEEISLRGKTGKKFGDGWKPKEKNRQLKRVDPHKEQDHLTITGDGVGTQSSEK